MLNILKTYLSFLGIRKKDVIKGILWSIVKSISVGLQLIAIYTVLKSLIEGNVNNNTIIVSFGIMFISMLLSVFANKYSQLNQIQGSFYMCADKRSEIGDRLKYFPMGYFNSTSVGKITSTVTTTLEGIQNEGTRIVMNVIQGIAHAVVLTLFMFMFDMKIGLIVLCGILLFVSINTFMQKKATKVSPQRHEAQLQLIDAILEYIDGIGVVRSYNLIYEANQRLKNTISECEKNNMNLEVAFMPFMFFQSLCLKLTSFIIIYVSLISIISGDINLAAGILMIVSSTVIFREVEVAGGMSSLLRLINKSMEDVKDILNVELMNNESSISIKENYDIVCKNISFSYDDKKIIDDVSFDIPTGKTTAIIGPSGGGKTTLCHLISRFWDVDEGQILFGGHNVKDYSLDYFFSNFSLVFQDVYLFNDTIANNIKFGKKDATKEEVINASKKACCHEFISKLENGYDTVIGKETNLSGGERQRISIARAIIKDSPIVILDEATANVDPENEASLQDAIAELTKNKTVIMIAHRLKTVRNADQILVVEDGKITEKGTHKHLMKLGKTYAKFVNMRNQSIGWKLGKVK